VLGIRCFGKLLNKDYLKSLRKPVVIKAEIGLVLERYPGFEEKTRFLLDES